MTAASSLPSRHTPELIARYRGDGLWTDDTMVSLLSARAAATPREVAVSDSRRRLTWEELSSEARSLAVGLKRFELPANAPVIVQLPNRVSNVVLRYALKLARLVGVYTPVTWRERELRQVLQKTGSRLLIAPSGFRGLDFVRLWGNLEPSFPGASALFEDGEAFRGLLASSGGNISSGFAPEEVSLVCVSSGSTGVPKLCESPEAAQLANGRAMAGRLGIDAGDVVGILAPLDGGAGLMGWLIAVASGARLALADELDATAMLDLLERERVSLAATVPALLIRLLEAPELGARDLGSLRLVRTGSAALTPATAREAERRLGATLVPAAGTMEVLTYAQTAPADPESLRLDGSAGRPLPGNEARVVGDDGEPLPPGSLGVLQVRGAGTGSGYYRDGEATLEAWGALGPEGWFRTGDLAELDARGNVFIKGRTRDVIRRGGRSIFPSELEAALMEHEGVREAAVVGVPCEALGERTRAYVVTRGDRRLGEPELREFLETKRLATYKMPDEFRFLEELPRLPSAKVNRKALRSEV